MFYRQVFVYISTIQLNFTVSYLGILKFLSVIEIYNKMSEIPNFWLLALISQMPPYLIFILVSKSTHPVNMVLSSQHKCTILSLIRHTKKEIPNVVVQGTQYSTIKLSTVVLSPSLLRRHGLLIGAQNLVAGQKLWTLSIQARDDAEEANFRPCFGYLFNFSRNPDTNRDAYCIYYLIAPPPPVISIMENVEVNFFHIP